MGEPSKGKRGRKPCGWEFVGQPGPFKCSECDFSHQELEPAFKHMAKTHQGLARLNNQSLAERPMDKNEMTSWTKKAFTDYGVNFECPHPDCRKPYGSFLGFVYHIEQCGKTAAELFKDCVISGKKMVAASMASHMKSRHPAPQIEVKEEEEEQVSLLDSLPGPGSVRRSRTSAMRAKRNFAELSDSDNESGKPSKNERNKNGSSDLLSDKLKKKAKKNDATDRDFLPKEEIDSEEALTIEDEEFYEDDESEAMKSIYDEEDEDEEGSPRKISRINGHASRTVEKTTKLALCFQNDLLFRLRQYGNKHVFDSLNYQVRNISRKVVDISKTFTFLPPTSFKSTTLQANGNNDLQTIEPFKSLSNEKFAYFNVGAEIQAAAWCPQPLPEELLNSTEAFKGTTKLVENMPKSTEYMAILTTGSAEQSFDMDKQFLQIWKFDSSDGRDKCPTNPELQLIIQIDFCKVFAIEWCPNGGTYQDVLPIEEMKTGAKVNRMGLLALACQDSSVRILPIPQGVSSFEADKGAGKAIVYRIQPVIVLKDKEQFSPCTCLSWSNRSPYSRIVGGFQNGTIAYWDLTRIALEEDDDEKDGKDGCRIRHISCSSDRSSVSNTSSSSFAEPEEFFPTRMFFTPRRAIVNDLKWLSNDLFMTSHHDGVARVWNLNVWSGHYDVYDRNYNAIQKIDTHPVWYDSFMLMDFPVKRKGNLMIMCKQMDHQDSYTPLTHWKNIVLNDMSLSAWQYALLYGTANGSLHLSDQLRNPSHKAKKYLNWTIFRTYLGYRSIEAGKNAVMPVPKAKRGRKPKENEIVTKKVDVNFDPAKFNEDYYLIFDDQQKKETSSEETSDTSLTFKDPEMIFAVTHVAWNPNLPSGHWIFSANKAGLCYVASQRITEPRK